MNYKLIAYSIVLSLCLNIASCEKITQLENNYQPLTANIFKGL